MLNAHLKACFSLVPQVSRMLNVDLPKPVAAAFALTKARPPDVVAAPTSVELAAAIAQAADSGGDPASDPTVQTLLARRVLAELNIHHQIAAHAEYQLGQAIKGSAEAIVASWREALTAEAEALAAAKKTVGAGDVEDVFAWKNPTEAAASAWAVSRTSGARFDAAARAWWMLGLAAGELALNPHRRALVYGSVTLEQHRALPNRATAWEIVSADITLDLATYDTWAQRNRALDTGLAGEAATHDTEGRLRMKLASGGFVA